MVYKDDFTVPLLLLFCPSIFSTSYYEVTGPHGETYHEPYNYMSGFTWNTIGPALAGAIVAALIILGVMYCVGMGGMVGKKNGLNPNDLVVEEEEVDKIAAEGKPMTLTPQAVLEEATKNSSSVSRKRRSVGRHEARIIRAAIDRKIWNDPSNNEWWW